MPTAATAAVNTRPNRPRTAITSAPLYQAARLSGSASIRQRVYQAARLSGSALLRANDHAPGTVADRHLADDGERVGIDDRHIPRGAVGREEAGAVGAQSQPPGSCAHGDLADQLAVLRRDHRHGTAAPGAHVQP